MMKHLLNIPLVIFIEETLSTLPVLKNDTNNVIEFNSSFSDEIKTDEQRNFWNLLKITPPIWPPIVACY